MKCVGIIGYGMMGSALTKGIKSSFPKIKIIVNDPDSNKTIQAKKDCQYYNIAFFK